MIDTVPTPKICDESGSFTDTIQSFAISVLLASRYRRKFH